MAGMLLLTLGFCLNLFLNSSAVPTTTPPFQYPRCEKYGKWNVCEPLYEEITVTAKSNRVYFDEDDNPVYDEDGNPVYVTVDDWIGVSYCQDSEILEDRSCLSLPNATISTIIAELDSCCAESAECELSQDIMVLPDGECVNPLLVEALETFGSIESCPWGYVKNGQYSCSRKSTAIRPKYSPSYFDY